MTVHGIVCSRFDAIRERRQTVLIFAGDCKHSLALGDQLCLVGHQDSPRGYAGIVTSVSQHRLHDTLDADLPRLGCDRETFLASWDRTNPEAPHATNPEVTRVEFRPGFPEEVLVGQPGLLDIAEKAAKEDIQAAEDVEVFGRP
jgi:hypothetical protein